MRCFDTLFCLLACLLSSQAGVGANLPLLVGSCAGPVCLQSAPASQTIRSSDISRFMNAICAVANRGIVWRFAASFSFVLAMAMLDVCFRAHRLQLLLIWLLSLSSWIASHDFKCHVAFLPSSRCRLVHSSSKLWQCSARSLTSHYVLVASYPPPRFVNGTLRFFGLASANGTSDLEVGFI